MTPFALLCQRCGLSHREAADHLGVSLSTVQSWTVGRRSANTRVLTDLRMLYRRIEEAADDILHIMTEQGATEVQFDFAADDHEARAIGWPCVGAQAAVYGLVLARMPDSLTMIGEHCAPSAAAAATDAQQNSPFQRARSAKKFE